VLSSNQWIITQPTPCLLRLRASKRVLSRENVNSSVVGGGNTMRGAARISGLGREFDRHRQASAGKSSINRPSRLLQADPEELPHPRRQIEGGHVAVIPLAGNSVAMVKRPLTRIAYPLGLSARARPLNCDRAGIFATTSRYSRGRIGHQAAKPQRHSPPGRKSARGRRALDREEPPGAT
jgi:hypothetical protein